MRKTFLILSICTINLINATAQNVGIGTSSPDQRLTVVGDGSFSSGAMSYISNKVNGGGLIVANNNGNGQVIRMDGSNIQSTYSDPLVFPPSNFVRSLVLNPFGGNVGIGTNFTPEYKLHLWSNTEQLIKIDGNNSLVLFNDNSSNAQYGFIRAWTSNPFNPAGYHGLEIGTPPATGGDPLKRLMFSTNYNLRLTIMEDGNVGINTTAPNSKLEVNGSLSMPIRKLIAAGSYTITDDDYTIIIDMEGSTTKIISVVLPSPVNRKGRIYNIAMVNQGFLGENYTGGFVNIYNNGPALLAQLLESDIYYSGYQIIIVKTNCTLQSDGTQWYIISSDFNEIFDSF